jgi:hypothetical protein
MVVSIRSHFGDRSTANECWDVARPPSTTTWHTIFSFNPGPNTFLRTIPKGAHVYVEAGFELREADPDAEAGTPNAQRQIFLKHGTYPLYFMVYRWLKRTVPQKISVFSGIRPTTEERRSTNHRMLSFIHPAHGLIEVRHLVCTHIHNLRTILLPPPLLIGRILRT